MPRKPATMKIDEQTLDQTAYRFCYNKRIFISSISSFKMQVVSATSSQSANSVLGDSFTIHRIPSVIVFGDASASIAAEFQKFQTNDLIRHARIVSYRPESDG
ncbi:hypothetical protein JTB14_034471 [Gonioctena quinquepunctata]|nr:hypothetical protein JTB14_034471 [Gonioctena quinquepunctata]